MTIYNQKQMLEKSSERRMIRELKISLEEQLRDTPFDFFIDFKEAKFFIKTDAIGDDSKLLIRFGRSGMFAYREVKMHVERCEKAARELLEIYNTECINEWLIHNTEWKRKAAVQVALLRRSRRDDSAEET